jgi:hypothetical protein
VARTSIRIRVDLLGGGGITCDPSPGRIFVVGPSHTFEQFAGAIDAAFARWDLSHLHESELADPTTRLSPTWCGLITRS